MSPIGNYERIAFVASPISEAQEARAQLCKRYGDASADTADGVDEAAVGGEQPGVGSQKGNGSGGFVEHGRGVGND